MEEGLLGLQPDPVRELKQLQVESARLKKLVADLRLAKVILLDIAAECGAARADARGGKQLVSHHRNRLRRACRLLKRRRSVH